MSNIRYHNSADDTTIILDGSETSLYAALDTLDTF